MLNKDGGVEADITVSVLENGDGSSVIKPSFEGSHYLSSSMFCTASFMSMKLFGQISWVSHSLFTILSCCL